jgi:4-aminobutyrate aminotransferase/(S)-3-amino-2-methylpropionate transaminase
VTVERAKGAEIWDTSGRRYLDFAGGIGVLNVGHCHPKIVTAIRAQSEKLIHTAISVATYESYVALCERMNQLGPGPSRKKCALFNSGAEAVENAVKIARFATGRHSVIAFEGSFHGRTLLTMSLTGKTASYKVGFGPYAPEVFHAPFPNSYRAPTDRTEMEHVDDCISALERMFRSQVPARDVACIILEVVQGEGGFLPAPSEFVAKVKSICDREGILLIVDEIQSGIGRTGRFFALEHYNLDPDLICFAKSIAAGLPLSGVVGRADVMDSLTEGAIGGTFGGNPISCAAGLAVLDAIEEERLLDRSTELGFVARRRLLAMQQRHAIIGDVRGIGSMLAAEIVKDRLSKTPDRNKANTIVRECESRGLILAMSGEYMNVVRLLYPLVITNAQLEEGMDILEEAVAAVS